MSSRIRRAVRERARGRCEYCQLPQAEAAEPFNSDHVIARQHRGVSTEENLAFACASCNRHKGPNIAGIDPDTLQAVTLFNPRRDVWAEHFEWEGAVLKGRTPIGRVTVQVLDINNADRVLLRTLLIDLGVFPPRD
jgi:hypothetical protein